MDKTYKTSKLEKFVADQMMTQSVYEVIFDSFLKHRNPTDINYLAASRLAIDFLQDAWREFEKYKPREQAGSRESGQVGL